MQHWNDDHGELCKEFAWWTADDVDYSEPIEGLISTLRNIVSLGRGDDDEEESEPATKKDIASLKQNRATLMQLRRNTISAKRSKNSEDLYKQTKGGPMTQVLTEMRQATAMVKKGDSKAIRAAMKAKPAGRGGLALIKSWAAKFVLAGFKVTFAGGKIGVGAAGEAVAFGMPLDTIVDGVAVVLDVMIFVTTTVETVIGVARSLASLKSGLESSVRALLTFNGGVSGVRTAVDNLMALAGKGGAKVVGKVFGKLIQLYDRVIRWGAPVIGSVIGFIAVSDFSISGRVIEFFLYIAKFMLDKAFPLIEKAWKYLPDWGKDLITNKQRMTDFLASVVMWIRTNLFNAASSSWKYKLLDSTRRYGYKIASWHPLVLVGIVKRKTLDERSRRVVEQIKKASKVLDRKMDAWLENVVIPNLGKIPIAIHAAMGLTTALFYLAYRYTPASYKKILSPAKAAAADMDALFDHLHEDSDAQQRFAIDDAEERRHEVRAIMCDLPTPEGLQYVCGLIDVGVQLDADHPALSVEPGDSDSACNFRLYRRSLFLDS